MTKSDPLTEIKPIKELLGFSLTIVSSGKTRGGEHFVVFRQNGPPKSTFIPCSHPAKTTLKFRWKKPG